MEVLGEWLVAGEWVGEGWLSVRFGLRRGLGVEILFGPLLDYGWEGGSGSWIGDTLELQGWQRRVLAFELRPVAPLGTMDLTKECRTGDFSSRVYSTWTAYNYSI